MKNIIIAIVFCSLFQTVKAQNYIPTIKSKTELNYVCKLHGQTRTLSLTAKKVSDTLVLDLITRDVKSSIVTMPEGLKNGNALCYNQGETSPVLNLKPTETFFMISRAAYQDLLKNSRFIYNSTTYVLDANTDKNSVSIDGKSVDALHVVAQVDETEMWIVKNPDFPLICKLTKNPLGINWTLVKIVDK
jgi:predicted RNase H-like nuclease